MWRIWLFVYNNFNRQLRLLHRHALGQISWLVHVATARDGDLSKFFGGRERQAAFAVEKLFQPPVSAAAMNHAALSSA
jgi:hypothetical protein